jgi:hypothetical protein
VTSELNEMAQYSNKHVPNLVKPVCTGTDINEVAERCIFEVGLSI